MFIINITSILFYYHACFLRTFEFSIKFTVLDILLGIPNHGKNIDIDILNYVILFAKSYIHNSKKDEMAIDLYTFLVKWGILPCRFAVCPLGGGILSRSNCLHDQKHFVPLCRVSLKDSLPTSENCTISVAPLCES